MAVPATRASASPPPGPSTTGTCNHTGISKTIDWKSSTFALSGVLHALNSNYTFTDVEIARLFQDIHPVEAQAPDCIDPICPAYVNHLRAHADHWMQRDGSAEATRRVLERNAGCGKAGKPAAENLWTMIKNQIEWAATRLGIDIKEVQPQTNTRLQKAFQAFHRGVAYGVAANEENHKKATSWFDRNDVDGEHSDDDDEVEVRFPPSNLAYVMENPDFPWMERADGLFEIDWKGKHRGIFEYKRQGTSEEARHTLPQDAGQDVDVEMVDVQPEPVPPPVRRLSNAMVRKRRRVQPSHQPTSEPPAPGDAAPNGPKRKHRPSNINHQQTPNTGALSGGGSDGDRAIRPAVQLRPFLPAPSPPKYPTIHPREVMPPAPPEIRLAPPMMPQQDPRRAAGFQPLPHPNFDVDSYLNTLQQRQHVMRPPPWVRQPYQQAPTVPQNSFLPDIHAILRDGGLNTQGGGAFRAAGGAPKQVLTQPDDSPSVSRKIGHRSEDRLTGRAEAAAPSNIMTDNKREGRVSGDNDNEPLPRNPIMPSSAMSKEDETIYLHLKAEDDEGHSASYVNKKGQRLTDVITSAERSNCGKLLRVETADNKKQTMMPINVRYAHLNRMPEMGRRYPPHSGSRAKSLDYLCPVPVEIIQAFSIEERGPDAIMRLQVYKPTAFSMLGNSAPNQDSGSLPGPEITKPLGYAMGKVGPYGPLVNANYMRHHRGTPFVYKGHGWYQATNSRPGRKQESAEKVAAPVQRQKRAVSERQSKTGAVKAMPAKKGRLVERVDEGRRDMFGRQILDVESSEEGEDMDDGEDDAF